MKSALMMLACTAMSFAAGSSVHGSADCPSPYPAGFLTDDAIFSQEYSFAYCFGGFRHWSMCDDFQLSADAYL
jgi:hypothetical protein